MVTTSGLFQTTFPQFHDKPYYLKALHSCDRRLGITILSCRACPVIEETEVCPLPSYLNTDGKQVSCCQCPFLPCRCCCPCGILSNGMLGFSSELSLLDELAEGVGSQQRIPFDKTARCAQLCMCSIHVILITGQCVSCLSIPSLPPLISTAIIPSHNRQLQESACCL